MNTNTTITRLKQLRDKTTELLKRDPKRTKIIAGSAIVAAIALSASEDGIGFGGWKKHEVVDSNGPGGHSMVAATLETPAGWDVEGGVNWHNPNDSTDPYKMSFTALSPDGKLRVQMLPSQNWASGAASQGFARHGSAETAESVVRKLFVPALRKGAQILKVERDPEAEARVAATVSSFYGAGASPGSGNRPGFEAVTATIEYDEGGTRYHEQILSIMQWLDMGQMNSRFNHSQIFTLRAPAGQLEESLPTLEKISNSLKREEKWQAVVANYQRGKSSEHFRNSGARLANSSRAHQERRRNNQAAFDASQQNYHDGQAANDANHRNWLNGHLGQADFHNPHSGMIENHTDYGDRVWQDGSGNTFGTENWQDDPRNYPNNWGRGVEEMDRVEW